MSKANSHLNSPIRIGLLGSTGRMGQQVSNLLSTEFSSKAFLKEQASHGSPLEPLLHCQAVIDFSNADAMYELAQLALSNKSDLPIFIVGSSAWGSEGQEILQKLSQKTPVLMTINFSAGV